MKFLEAADASRAVAERRRGRGRGRQKESERERDVGQRICAAGIAPVLRPFQGSFKAVLRLY
jgi:hypothetical protein